MRNTITTEEVKRFKELCVENKFISEILKNEFQEYFVEPILDAGAGNGDICFYTCPDKEVYLVDINNYENDLNPDKHKKLLIDFFEYIPEKKVNTVLISHSLQYLDENIGRLNDKITQLDPENIILIVNENEGIMKEILNWLEKNGIKANPDIAIPNDFPLGDYNLKHKREFEVKLVCENFCTLAQQVAYLMLFFLTSDNKGRLIDFLKGELGQTPSFPIKQAIYGDS